MTALRDVFCFDVPSKNCLDNREFLCGIELEIENVKKHPPLTDSFLVKEDPSLRNTGFEYIFGPRTFEGALSIFEYIHTYIKLGQEPFTDRTSIHVHVNMASLTEEEVKQFILTYALFEPLFFDFVGPKRKENIYCVPLNYTFLPSIYHKNLQYIHSKWSKYAAFNICPLGNHPDNYGFGTIEFRHMYGTADKDLFYKWLSSIKELYTFIEQTKEFNIVSKLKQRQPLSSIARLILPTLSEPHTNEAIDQMCYDTCIDVKLSEGTLVS